MARDEEIQYGKKRPAQADPDAQPLAKRFGRLRIDNSLPISARTKIKGYQPPEPTDTDTMLLDDTKHTTYIHNLEQELAEIESPGLVFLPFAEKVLSVPQSVLSDSKPSGKELILYTEPSSLTVPQDKDSVRKAIIESRERERARARGGNKEGSTSSSTCTKRSERIEDEEDPMDIDG